jgi:hypothetical protein
MAFLTVQPYTAERPVSTPVATDIVKAATAGGLIASSGQRGVVARRNTQQSADSPKRRLAAFAEDGLIRPGMYVDRLV